MGKYTMAQVEKLTGIKSHTLRVWERRYNFLNPSRTKTNIRYYSDEELRRLLNIDVLIKKGYRVSAIDKMSDEEINTNVENTQSFEDSEFGEEINRLTLHMIDLNEEGFIKTLDRQTIKNGLLSTVVHLVYPFLEHVGVLWAAERVLPAHEHFVSNIIRQKIIAGIDIVPIPKSAVKKMILFLPEGETHEIGLLMAHYIAKDLGFKVYYLGQNVPLENVKQIHEKINADYLFTIITNPMTNDVKSFVGNYQKDLDVTLAISSKKELSDNLGEIENVILIDGPKSYIDFLNQSIQ